LPTDGVAIIADSPEKFLSDNVGFSGTIFDSSFSLKNTGETIILRNTDLVDSDSVSYTSDQGAKGDGNSLQKTNSGWVSATPTPGSSSISTNLVVEPLGGSDVSEVSGQSEPISAPESFGKTWFVKPQIFTRIRNTPKVVMVGADILIKGETLGLEKEPLEGARYLWTFGDGGTKEGQKVFYNYNYPGKYVVILNTSSGIYSASDRIIIEAIPADITISSVGTGSNSFVEVNNKTKYELNLSRWKLRAGNKLFEIPENTVILPDSKIIFPSQYTKFEITKGQNIELLYPNSTSTYSYIWRSEVQMNTQVKSKPDIPLSPPPQATQKSVQGRTLDTLDTKNKAATKTSSNEDKNKKESDIEIVQESQSANIFIASNKNNNNIYKWLFGVTALVVISIIGVFFIGRVKSETLGISKEADKYEIIEDED